MSFSTSNRNLWICKFFVDLVWLWIHWWQTKANFFKVKCVQKKVDWAEYHNRHRSKSMSDKAVILLKWFSHGGIILAKGQLGHSYTFWTMPIMIFSPVSNFGNQSLRLTFLSLWFSFSQNFSCMQNQMI